MRPSKFLIVSATMLATTTFATLSFADNTTPPSTPPTSDTSSTMGTGSSSTGSSTVTPTAPTTSTTVTTQGTPGATTMPPPPTTSTTTITSAEDVSAAAPAPMVVPTATPRETVTVYQSNRPNKALLITGLATLAGTYTTTAAFHAANGPIADKDLYIPIVGPWINLANPTPNQDTRDTVLIAGSGVLQGVGAILALTSFFVPEKVPAARIQAGPVKMNISPTAQRGGGGIGAVGTF